MEGVGWRLLRKMGCQEGGGLGKYEQGIREPLSASGQSHRHGVAYVRHPNRGDASSNSIRANAGPLLPEILLTIATLHIFALVDTRSEITCISQNTWDQVRSELPDIPVLPLKAIQAQGAFSSRSRKITQVYLPLVIKGHPLEFCCLIVSDLVRPCILGIDWLSEFQCRVCLRNRLTITPRDAPPMHVTFTTVTGDRDAVRIEKDESELCGVEINATCVMPLQNFEQKVTETTLGDRGKEQLRQLLAEYNGLFSDQPGRTGIYEHEIEMRDNTPFIWRSYPVPFAVRGPVEQKLKEMLDLGVISRAASPYSSPMTVVRKKDGSVRLSLDARWLNEKMIADVKCPPSTEELL